MFKIIIILVKTISFTLRENLIIIILVKTISFTLRENLTRSSEGTFKSFHFTRLYI